MKKDILQKPWEPVELKETNSSINVKVWGREYGFTRSFLPSSIKTAGADILSAPITLHAFFDGEEHSFCDTRFLNVEHDEAACEFNVAQTAKNIVVNSRVRVEYDGLVRMKFSIIPFWNEEWNIYAQDDSEYRLDKLYLDIPIKKQYAGLYHFFPAGESTIVLFSHELPSGKLKENMKLPFKVYSWLGWEDGGLGVFFEGEKNIELAQKDCCIEYIMGDDDVTMRIHLLDAMPKKWQGTKEAWADGSFPIEYEIGLQATPVKPRENDRLTKYQMFHMDNTAEKDKGYIYKEFEESEEKGRELIRNIADSGAKYLLILGWTKMMNYWEPIDEEKFRRFVSICHEYHLEPMLYFGYEYSTLMPDWYNKADYYLNKNVKGNLTDGWLIKNPWQRAYTVCLNCEEYADEFVNGILLFMDKYSIKAIYFDGTYNPWECANEQHGCGYRDEWGGLHHTYPIYAVREFAKKIYKGVHDRGGIIEVHQSGTCLTPTMSFCDISFTGESIQPQVRKDRKFLSFDSFRAEFTGINTGINVQFMAVEKDGISVEDFAAITLPHGVLPLPRLRLTPTLSYVSAIWEANCKFGIDTAEWIPYWVNDRPVTSDVDGVYVSVYKKNKEYLAVATSVNDESIDVALTLQGKVCAAECMMTGKKLESDGNTVKTVMKPYKLEMIYIKEMD